MAMADLVAAMPGDRSLLIVEDDKSFLQRLARAMEGRGFTVTTAESVADGLTQLETTSPAFAVVDMRLEDGNGLEVISALKRRRPDARAIILTGYGNIATAVNAVKLGAVDYLSKPVDADDVVAALLALEGRRAELGAHPAHLRALRPQRLRDRAPPQHASPHAPAHFGQARAEVSDPIANPRDRVAAFPFSPLVLPALLVVRRQMTGGLIKT
jgi:two-component system response regulator RegA